MAHSQINLLGPDTTEQKINLNYKEVVNDIYRYLKVIKQNNVKTERNLATTLETIITNQVQILQRLDLIDSNIKGLQDKITEADTLEKAELEALNLSLSSSNVVQDMVTADDCTSVNDTNMLDNTTARDMNCNNINNSGNNLDSLFDNEIANNILNEMSDDTSNNTSNTSDNIIDNILDNNQPSAYTEDSSEYNLEDTQVLTNEILVDIKSLTTTQELSRNVVDNNDTTDTTDNNTTSYLDYLKEQIPYKNNNSVRKTHAMLILD
jgi:hypothetical protein